MSTLKTANAKLLHYVEHLNNRIFHMKKLVAKRYVRFPQFTNL